MKGLRGIILSISRVCFSENRSYCDCPALEIGCIASALQRAMGDSNEVNQWLSANQVSSLNIVSSVRECTWPCCCEIPFLVEVPRTHVM